MSKHWGYFLAAAVMGGFILVTHGAPPLAVAIGIAGAALFASRKSHVF